MDVLLSPPLRIELLKATPAATYQEVSNSLNTCLKDDALLPNVAGANTYHTKAHLCRIIDEVTFLHRITKSPQSVSLSTTEQKPTLKASKKKRKSETAHDDGSISARASKAPKLPTSKESVTSQSTHKKPRKHSSKILKPDE